MGGTASWCDGRQRIVHAQGFDAEAGQEPLTGRSEATATSAVSSAAPAPAPGQQWRPGAASSGASDGGSASSSSPHRAHKAELLAGMRAIESQRMKKRAVQTAVLGCYIAAGLAFYPRTQGWLASQTLVFELSILTGVGYGHLVPDGDVGLLVTTAYIIVGVMVGIAIAGQVLDAVVQSQMKRVAERLRRGKTSEGQGLGSADIKRQHCILSLWIVAVVYASAVFLFMAWYGLDAAEAIYTAAVSVFMLDSFCAVEGVRCSGGWHSHTGASAGDALFAIAWYFVTCGSVGNCLVAIAKYMGHDREGGIGQIRIFDTARLARMDYDGDGKVTKEEFLRDRLIRANLCTPEQIDHILKNFDELDRTADGFLTKRDVPKSCSSISLASALTMGPTDEDGDG